MLNYLFLLFALIMVPRDDTERVTLFLSGDVMTGRGIDQVLPHSVDPVLYESWVRDARRYVTIAERANGAIPEKVDYGYIWGEALGVLDRIPTACRIINLETSVTTSPDYWKGKGINYRMHPGNVELFDAAGIDCCVLANNHVLDWGYKGLKESLETLSNKGFQTAGAGRDLEDAAEPAVINTDQASRILVFSVGTPDCGIPQSWAAQEDKPGVNFIPDYSENSVSRLSRQIGKYRKPGDLVILSIHWGGNWGYHIPQDQQYFAHRLIEEAGVDVVHGHSSHHVKGMEVYKNKLILYGCGDLINDYEGIGGHEAFRPDLSLMYFPELDPGNGDLIRLRMVPTRMRNFQLRKASAKDRQIMLEILNRECGKFGLDVSSTGEELVIHNFTKR